MQLTMITEIRSWKSYMQFFLFTNNRFEVLTAEQQFWGSDLLCQIQEGRCLFGILHHVFHDYFLRPVSLGLCPSFWKLASFPVFSSICRSGRVQPLVQGFLGGSGIAPRRDLQPELGCGKRRMVWTQMAPVRERSQRKAAFLCWQSSSRLLLACLSLHSLLFLATSPALITCWWELLLGLLVPE